MSNKKVNTPVDEQLLKTAQDGNLFQFTQCVERIPFTVDQLKKALNQTMNGYQPYISFLLIRYNDVHGNKKEIGCETEDLLKTWWEKNEKIIQTGPLLWNPVLKQWIDISEEKFSIQNINTVTEPVDTSLDNRIQIIKKLLELLEYSNDHNDFQLNKRQNFFNFFHRRSSLTSQKKLVFKWAAQVGAMELIQSPLLCSVANHTKNRALQCAIAEQQCEIAHYLYTHGAVLKDADWERLMTIILQCGIPSQIHCLLPKELHSHLHYTRLEKILFRIIQDNQSELLDTIFKILSDQLKYPDPKLIQILKKAIVLAAQHDDAAAVRKLLKMGVSVDTSDSKGSTLLLISIERQTFPLTAFLLKNHASLYLTNHSGVTPAQAISTISNQTTRELLSKFSDVPLKNDFTLIHTDCGSTIKPSLFRKPPKH